MTAPRMRAGNTDRQGAVDGLTRHFTDGRLDAGEFDERVGKAYAATPSTNYPPCSPTCPRTRRAADTNPGFAGRTRTVPVRSDRPADPVPRRGRPDRSSTGHRGSWLCSGCWRCSSRSVRWPTVPSRSR